MFTVSMYVYIVSRAVGSWFIERNEHYELSSATTITKAYGLMAVV